MKVTPRATKWCNCGSKQAWYAISAFLSLCRHSYINCVVGRMQESFELFEDSIPLAMQNSDEPMHFTLGHDRYRCALSSTHQEITAPTTDLTDEHAIIASLIDSCMILPQSWWNYEWCFRREICQFHLDYPTPNTPP